MRGEGTGPNVRWARRAGFTAGLALLVMALILWRVPPWQGPALGAEVVFTTAPTGELEVSPVGQFLSGKGLRPLGAGLTGTVTVTNQTGKTLDVRLRTQPSASDLDHGSPHSLHDFGDQVTAAFRGQRPGVASSPV